MGDILLVSPHPDDVLWGCLGYIIKYKDKGYTYLVLSKGEKGYNNISSLKNIIDYLNTELNVKIKLVIENFPDTKLNNYLPEISQLIKNIIEKENFSIIFTTSVKDYHQDHRTAFRATEIATRYLPVSVIQYSTPSSYFKPNLFVTISQSILEIKKSLLLKYKEETGKNRPYYNPDYMDAFHIYYSTKANSLVEAFYVHKLIW